MVARMSDGTVRAWGRNNYGQLGDGTTTDHNTPVPVSALVRVTAVSAGDFHTVALLSDGTVRAWGYNNRGQLGNGATNNSSTPVAVKIKIDQLPQLLSLQYMTAIAAGSFHTVALKCDGTVWAWGSNVNGQLGDGTTTDSHTAIQVPGLNGVTAIASGYSHTVALMNNGTVKAWGANAFGQLGDGTTTERHAPVSVSGLNGVVAIAVGGLHTVALKSDGTVWAWGYNAYGQLGDGTTYSYPTPVPVSVLDGITAIAAGSHHTVALKNDGTIRAWGYNANGQLGDGTIINHGASSNPIPGLGGVIAIAAKQNQTVALKDDETAWSWGENAYGQLGNGSHVERHAPGPVTGIPAGENVPMRGIATGETNSVALASDGTVRAWGDNSYGQLGDGTTTDRQVPFPVPVLTGVATVAAGYFYTVALGSDGMVRTWGYNQDGQLGDGTYTERHAPVSVPGLGGVTAIAAMHYHTLALTSDGTVRAWGVNSNGQLGDGTTTNRNAPVTVSALSGVTAITAGTSHSVALRNDGTVWAWGDNRFGQLGDGTTTDRHTPVMVTGLGRVIAIAAGALHTVALGSDGTLWAWGHNVYGQLGDGTNIDRLTPVTVLSGATGLAAGGYHTLALLHNGTVQAWGYNNFGQLGNGTTTDRNTPSTVPGLIAVVALAAGSSHSMALKSDGTVWAWGDNRFGQLGDGTTTERHAPAQTITGNIALTTILTGTGSGSVHSDPQGLFCSAGSCTAMFPTSTSVALLPTPDADSIFVDWTGACTGSGDCSLTMSGAKTVYAQFSYIEPVKLLGGNFFVTLSAAYSAAQHNDTIMARSASFKEDLVLDRNIAVNLTGGYDTAFGNNSYVSTLEGVLMIKQGTATIENLAIHGGASTDMTPPTVPQSLTGVVAGSSQIDLSWTASTDNVGVTLYRVYGDDNNPVTPHSFIRNETETSTSMTGLAASTQYCYLVSAVDAAGNASLHSNRYCATTLSNGQTAVRFYSVKDAEIAYSDQDSGFAGRNYGGETWLEVGNALLYGSYSDANTKHAILVDFAFDPAIWSGKTIVNATLRLYVDDYAIDKSGRYVAYKIDDTSNLSGNLNYPWSELGVTWNNCPTYSLLSPKGTAYPPDSPSEYTEWDVTSMVQEWFTSGTMGNGIVIYDMEPPYFYADQVTTYLSREYPVQAYRPQLIITY